ncbi:Spermidine/putrescine import ATP-binding protein PotA [Thalassovita gelatinovora]|uniref:Spermidine/putrescine import ATP-binding protein PotA n=1 Tax=Thalassovita gelatinovora TaxID=53501 RepID=A0A0P1FB24_THAGE|nr:ABC transporter ATP-binding protein [Thalassovita gelatinovora]QIZ80726.1 ABC transporter ATP-binding protein [Thalassovita gelatinovora]CUH65339.1 Spermidine/putrescine import ATP-binding protein PotA [Thalassovita gelatinovora]SEQ89575.1 spermidine/putrescine transport system ATP-binding protein [Thalassovita gelatinovora]
MPFTADLVCRDLTKEFKGFRAVDHVSFDVPQGSFFSILGPSGCGKTTLLRMIAGFQFPTSGDLLIKGKSMIDVGPNKRPVSMVFQHLALFPMMDIGKNIGFGLRQRGVPAAEIKQRVGRVLERVGLPGIENRQVSQLSGGQKQRVAIARCMVLEPDVLLLDEPLGALDLKLREHMKIELKALQAEFNTTFVYITHDQSEALVMSDNIAVMNKGKFDQIGTAKELYYEPANAFVAGFVGDANRFEGKVTAINDRLVTIVTDGGITRQAQAAAELPIVGQRALAFVRPEAIQLSKTAYDSATHPNASAQIVDSVLFNGANSVVLLRDPQSGETLHAGLPQTGDFLGLGKGETIHTNWHATQARCFVAEGH